MTQLTPDQISAALKSGIISTDQAKNLTRIYQAAHQGSGPANDEGPADTAATAQIGNEEDMRFVRSFSDLFIALGIILLALGLSALAGLSGGGAVYLLAALIMAALAEYFGRRRKQNAPTLVTAIAFLIFVQKGLSAVMPDMAWSMGGGRDISVALVTFLAMAGFYWRIRLPFCMALMALALFYLTQSILAAIMGDIYLKYIGGFFLSFGILTFLAAMAYDVRDPKRRTRFSDNAFWLHFIAAPLMLHGIFMQFFSLKFDLLFGFIPMIKLDSSDALFILLIVSLFTLIALAINRRIFMVATLGYAALAMGYLMHSAGLGFGAIFALTALFMGAAIIMLGVGWNYIRAGLLKVLPKTRFFPPVVM